jgi:hypothetical protein
MISRVDFEETLGFRPPPWERVWQIPSASTSEAEAPTPESARRHCGTASTC